MSDYKVNLPQTKFPMKADLAKREPKMLDFWQSIDLYGKTFCIEGRDKFILHDGPPYANGAIHLGHAVNKILKDIVLKSKLLDGYSTPYVPGWDCHGLPIELNVEKKIGKVGDKVSAEQFIAAARKYADEQIDSQRKDFLRLGVIGDWQNPYKTANFASEAGIIRALGTVIANGYVERGFKPVHWCTACGSALAEAEVEYQDKTSPAIDVAFRVVDPKLFYDAIGIPTEVCFPARRQEASARSVYEIHEDASDEANNAGKQNAAGIVIPIWTTTPWTLPANEAVCLHPELEYALVYSPILNEHLVILVDLIEPVLQRYGEANPTIKKKFIGKDLECIKLHHPFLEKIVPVILGKHVTTDAGTGAVHTAPAHGQEDFAIGQEYKLPVKNPVGSDGKFIKHTPFFAGENVFAANDLVINLLREKGSLLHAESLQHSYPHCWRHKTPLIFRATQQWFISMDKKVNGMSLREKALAAVENIQWFPERGKERMKDMLSNRPDWCISRQRVWGTPITLFVHKDSGELHPEWQQLLEIVARNVEQQGVLFWRQLQADTFLKENAPNFPSENFEKVTDTLDVWFDSGTTHYYVLGKNPDLKLPANLYLEGSDQYRGWFQSSLLTSLITNDESPYLQNVTHGFTVDAQGHKMSKSLGNVIVPQKVTDTLGADVLRLWVASTYLYDDFPLSDEILQRNVDGYRIFRNTARFLLGNLFDFNPKTDLVDLKDLLALDKWAIQQIWQLQESFKADYNNYQMHSACSNFQAVLATEISSFYFSVIKDRLYTMAPKSLGRRSAQTALYHILEMLVRILAPICSFTAEEIWQEMRQMWVEFERPESVFLSLWYKDLSEAELSATKISPADWTLIRNVRDAVNKKLEELRTAGKIGSSLAAEVTLFCKPEILGVLNKLQNSRENEMRFVLITSTAKIKGLAEVSADALPTAIEGVSLGAQPSQYKKCCRCWHYREDVGVDPKHPEICGRCDTNLFGEGEERFFA